MNDGVSWNVSTPKVCSTTFPTSDEIGAVIACVARAARISVCACVGFWSARSSGAMSLRVDRRLTSPKSSASTSAVGSHGSELTVGRSCSAVPAAPTVTR